MIGKIAAAVLAALTLTVSGEEKGLLFHADFSRDAKVELHRKAKISDEVLQLSGKGDFATIPDSGKMHPGKKGMTLLVTAKLNEAGNAEGSKEVHDMFVSKGKEFIFGRWNKRLYFNFHNGSSWCAYTFGAAPMDGQWAHYAVTVEYYEDTAQGETGYRIGIFVNGDRELTRKIQFEKIKEMSDPIQIGNGFGGGPWYLNGEIASVRMYDRPLSDAEVSDLCSREKRVKFTRKGSAEISGSLRSLLEKVPAESSPEFRWAVDALRRGAVNRMDQQKTGNAVRTLLSIGPVRSLETLAGKFNAAQSDFRILTTSGMAVLTAVGTGKGNHPLLGVFDRKSSREIFGEKTISWQIHWRADQKELISDNEQDDLVWTASLKDQTLKISWKKSESAMTAESAVTFTDNRIESTFSVKNLSSDKLIEEVVYPQYCFAKLPGGKDQMAYPNMCGVEVSDPTVNSFQNGQSGTYPSGSVTMQFGAYYNETSGVYFGFEDGLARTKNYSVTGKRGNLNVQWSSPVARKNGSRGGNHFSHNGKAVIELYGNGGWYEAGQIYRKFLEKDAAWWIPELPRKTTPEWFRNNTMWICDATHDRKRAEKIRDDMACLRGYLELPFGFHWYEWNDNKKLGWPHFPPKDFTAEINRQIRSYGIYTVPYIDSRLWKEKDGPNGTDYMYKSHGLKYAVRDNKNQLFHEVYSSGRYTIMCPAAKGWQDFLTRLTIRIANSGFDGVYHDQVGTGKPRMCFASGHGHLFNDSSLHLEHGYWQIFEKIFAALRGKHPNFCHTTEENAEPYLQQMDGYMVWRWTMPEQIPLYQSIYSGRAQFVGRFFKSARAFDPDSFFSIVGQQLVNAEQIGWFPARYLMEGAEKRLYVKKTMHVRHALLKYFNEGRMLAPVKFRVMPKEKVKWSGVIPQFVVMPKIANSAWLGPDGSRMWLFTNTQKNESVTAIPEIPSEKGFWLCREGAETPVFSQTALPVKLAKLSSEIWIEGSRDAAVKIQAVLKKLASFDYGKSIRFSGNYAHKKHIGKPNRLFSPDDAAGYSNCGKFGNSHFGWIENGAKIGFGEIDFGESGARTIVLKAAVGSNYAGGEIEIRCRDPKSGEGTVGKLKLTSTDGWNKYKEFPVKLNRPLTGKCPLSFVFYGHAACNFAGWKYLAE